MVKYFIAGFLIAFFFDGISTILSYIVEWIKMTISVRIAKQQIEIAKSELEVHKLSSEVDEHEQEPMKAIGFAVPDDNWRDSDEE